MASTWEWERKTGNKTLTPEGLTTTWAQEYITLTSRTKQHNKRSNVCSIASMTCQSLFVTFLLVFVCYYVVSFLLLFCQFFLLLPYQSLLMSYQFLFITVLSVLKHFYHVSHYIVCCYLDDPSAVCFLSCNMCFCFVTQKNNFWVYVILNI